MTHGPWAGATCIPLTAPGYKVYSLLKSGIAAASTCLLSEHLAAMLHGSVRLHTVQYCIGTPDAFNREVTMHLSGTVTKVRPLQPTKQTQACCPSGSRVLESNSAHSVVGASKPRSQWTLVMQHRCATVCQLNLQWIKSARHWCDIMCAQCCQPESHAQQHS